MIGSFLGQLQSDPQLQAAVLIFLLLMASLVGGIGRLVFMTFVSYRLARLAIFAGFGTAGLAWFV